MITTISTLVRNSSSIVRTQPHSTRTSINRSDAQSDYDHISDIHNIVLGSLALLLVAATIVLAIVLYRLDRRRSVRSSNGAVETVRMDDLGA